MNRFLQFLLNTPPRFMFQLAKYRMMQKKTSTGYENIKPCAFVLSTGRVGTATLAELFELDKNINAYHEPLPKLFGLSRICYDRRAGLTMEPNLEAALVEAFLTSRRDLLDYSNNLSRGYVETSPHVTFTAPCILKVIPATRFFHVVRNPREVITSGLRRKWYAGQINDQWRITPRQGDPFEPLWEKLDQFEKILWLWAETNRWILDFSSTLAGDRCLLIHAEDLFAMKAETIHALYEHLGLSLPAERKIRRIVNKRLNSQKSGGFDTPQDWNRQIHADLAQFVTQVANSLGYKFT